MAPAEIDAALKRIVSEAGAVARDPLLRELRTLGATIGLLAVIVGEQERRLRAIEAATGGETLDARIEAVVGRMLEEAATSSAFKMPSEG